MTSALQLDTVHRLGIAVRSARKQQRLTQAELALRAHVSRVFVIDLEAGHPRAELGKALAVLDALGLQPFADERSDDMSNAVADKGAQPASPPYSPSFVVAESLDELHGPARGEVTLPNRLMWNPSRPFDLADEKRRRSMIRIVLREARTQEDLADYIDRESLVSLWPSLGIPETIAVAWEKKFPELATAAGDRR